MCDDLWKVKFFCRVVGIALSLLGCLNVKADDRGGNQGPKQISKAPAKIPEQWDYNPEQWDYKWTDIGALANYYRPTPKGKRLIGDLREVGLKPEASLWDVSKLLDTSKGQYGRPPTTLDTSMGAMSSYSNAEFDHLHHSYAGIMGETKISPAMGHNYTPAWYAIADQDVLQAWFNPPKDAEIESGYSTFSEKFIPATEIGAISNGVFYNPTKSHYLAGYRVVAPWELKQRAQKITALNSSKNPPPKWREISHHTSELTPHGIEEAKMITHTLITAWQTGVQAERAKPIPPSLLQLGPGSFFDDQWLFVWFPWLRADSATYGGKGSSGILQVNSVVMFPMLVKPVWIPVNILERKPKDYCNDSNISENRGPLGGVLFKIATQTFPRDESFEASLKKAITALDRKVSEKKNTAVTKHTSSSCEDRAQKINLRELVPALSKYIRDPTAAAQGKFQFSSPKSMKNLAGQTKKICSYGVSENKLSKFEENIPVAGSILIAKDGHQFTSFYSEKTKSATGKQETLRDTFVLSKQQPSLTRFKHTLTLRQNGKRVSNPHYTGDAILISEKNGTQLLVDLDEHGEIYAVNVL